MRHLCLKAWGKWLIDFSFSFAYPLPLFDRRRLQGFGCDTDTLAPAFVAVHLYPPRVCSRTRRRRQINRSVKTDIPSNAVQHSVTNCYERQECSDRHRHQLLVGESNSKTTLRWLKRLIHGETFRRTRMTMAALIER